MNYDNTMQMSFPAKPVNEALARLTVSAFIAPLDPVLSDVSDIKTAVSEAVTNAIIHGYGEKEGEVFLFCGYAGRTLYITVEDHGCGIEDIEQARQPLFTTKPDEERSGMGFTVMETFMDNLDVLSAPGEGTRIKLLKVLSD